MENKIIDGKIISEYYFENMKKQVEEFKIKNIIPGLAVILVGDDPASSIYVKNKGMACEKLGIYSTIIRLSADTKQNELEDLIEELNNNEKINGILVQLPLPKHLNEEKALVKIKAAKDVDGFHIINSGKLLRGIKCIEPCTPKGVMAMLEYSNINLEGKHAVIIGRSNLVGKPLAIMLLQKNATVTICHSKTKNLTNICKTADILIAAVGIPNFVNSEMIKEGAIIIDVGISRLDGNIVGDVDFNDVFDKVSSITPVPGGVGKMTIAMLMKNTLEATNMQYELC